MKPLEVILPPVKKVKSENLNAKNKMSTLSKLILDFDDNTISVLSVSLDGESMKSEDNSIGINMSPSHISSTSVNSPYSVSRSAKVI